MPKAIVRAAASIEKILGARQIETEIGEGCTIEDLIGRLDRKIGGGLRNQLYDAEGSQSSRVRIFLNGRDVRFLEKKDLNLKDGDIVLFLPVLAGG